MTERSKGLHIVLVTLLCISLLLNAFAAFNYYQARRKANDVREQEIAQAVWGNAVAILDVVAMNLSYPQLNLQSWQEVFEESKGNFGAMVSEPSPEAKNPFPMSSTKDLVFGRMAELPPSVPARNIPAVWLLQEFPEGYRNQRWGALEGKTVVVFWDGHMEPMTLAQFGLLLETVKSSYPDAVFQVLSKWDRDGTPVWREITPNSTPSSPKDN